LSRALVVAFNVANAVRAVVLAVVRFTGYIVGAIAAGAVVGLLVAGGLALCGFAVTLGVRLALAVGRGFGG